MTTLTLHNAHVARHKALKLQCYYSIRRIPPSSHSFTNAS